MNLVEKVGPGLLRIRQMCEAYPCPPPHIEADADWYRIIFSRGEAEPYSLPRPESGLESKTAQSVLKTLGIQPLQAQQYFRKWATDRISEYLKDSR